MIYEDMDCSEAVKTLLARSLKEEIEFDTLILNAGGGSYPLGLTSGWAIVQLFGDTDAMSLDAFTSNNAGSPADIRTHLRHQGLGGEELFGRT